MSTVEVFAAADRVVGHLAAVAQADVEWGSPLRVEWRTEGGVATVALRGELDVDVADLVHDTLTGLDARRVVVDLTELVFCDAAGVSALVRAKHAIEAAGRSCALSSANGIVLRLFEILGLTGVLDG